MSALAARLKDLGLSLPPAPAPAANYVPYVISGKTLFISGQVSVVKDGATFIGKVGSDYSLEQGQEAAKVCALNIIAQAGAAVDGDMERIARVVKLGGFVNCTPEFDQQPAVINGASDLMVEVFGDKGRHARFAVGAPSLPFNVAVEIDAVIELA